MTNASTGGRSSLSHCGGKRVSVVLAHPSGDREVFGSAEFERDPLLGNVLRVSVDTAGFLDAPTELLISEAEWDGRIVCPIGEDCEFRFQRSSS